MLIAANLLGAFEVRVGSHLVVPGQWKLRHPRQLLQMLMVEPGGSLRREQVLTGLWPLLSAEAAANRLHHTLHLLRGVFARAGVPKDHPVVELDSGVLGLGASHTFEVDVQAFRERLLQARTKREAPERTAALAAALGLYRGELLDGTPYEDWLAPHREALRLDHLWALQELALLRRTGDEHDAAIALYQKIVEVDPANERAHRALMELFDHTDHPERAIHQYAVCKRCLQREVDADPSPATHELLQRIVARASQRPPRSAPAAAETRVRYTAPMDTTELLGRSQEVETLSRWLIEEGARLVTLCAGAGTGKTRLAQAVAERCQSHFEDGVVALELSGVKNGEQLVAQLATALQLEHADTLHIAQHLARRHTLLLLDRFEHLLDAAPLISRWLVAAPRLRVLVTSQAALRSAAERVFELTGLVGAKAGDAVTLFTRRAPANSAALADDNALAQADVICRRLDGNPLAIELAAGQAARLTLPQIIQGLDKPLDFLVDGKPATPALQRSLRDALAWSYELLVPECQRLFAMLGVFAGDFTLRDAQAVLAPFFDADAVHQGAQTLLARHLLTRRTGVLGAQSQARLVLLDAPRQLACDLSVGAAWRERLLVSHAEHVAACCAQLYECKVQGTPPPPPLAATLDVVLAEVRMIFAPGHPMVDARLQHRIAFHAGSLHMFTCAALEAQAWLRAAAALPAPPDSEAQAVYAKVHFTLGATHRILGEFREASACMRQARHLAVRAQPGSMLARTITSRLASFRAQQGRVRLARRMLQSLVRETAGATPKSLSEDLQALATFHILLGDLDDALDDAQRAYDLALEVGDAYGTLLAAFALGQVQLAMGHTDHARDTHDACLVMLEQGFPFNSSVAVRLADVVIDIEACEFVRAAAKLPALQHLVEPMRGRRLWRVVSAVVDWLRIERGRWSDVSFLDSTDADEFAFESDFGELFVVVQCLRTRLFARQERWDKARDCLDKLRQCKTLHGGALWAALIRIACCDVALQRGYIEAAGELFEQAVHRLCVPPSLPSPRMQRELAALRSRLPTRLVVIAHDAMRSAPRAATWSPEFEALLSGVFAMRAPELEAAQA